MHCLYKIQRESRIHWSADDNNSTDKYEKLDRQSSRNEMGAFPFYYSYGDEKNILYGEHFEYKGSSAAATSKSTIEPGNIVIFYELTRSVLCKMEASPNDQLSKSAGLW